MLKDILRRLKGMKKCILMLISVIKIRDTVPKLLQYNGGELNFVVIQCHRYLSHLNVLNQSKSIGIFHLTQHCSDFKG